jgi:non-ribosomal peptide synthetase component F
MSPVFVAKWSSSPSLKLFNTYGVTEVTVYQFVQQCSPEVSPKCIGFPMNGIDAYVLDDSLRVACVGVPGRLFLGGAQLSRGYWKYAVSVCKMSYDLQERASHRQKLHSHRFI